MLTQQQEADMRLLKRTSPFQIIVGFIHKDTKEFQMRMVYTMRTAKALARNGHEVYFLK